MVHFHYQNLAHWLYLHPQWGWVAAFVIAFAESVAIIGSIVPGSVTMTAIGILAGSAVLPLWPVIACAIFGAITGDGLSYLLGYYFKDNLQNIWPFRKHPQILNKGQLFFFKHGGKSIFIGRFVGPVRAIVPVVAGMLKLPPKRYFPISILSAIAWAPAYMLPGILLGAISLEMPAHIAAELIVGVLLLLVAIWLICWIAHQIYRKTRNYFNSILDRLWDKWALQRSKQWICFLLRNGEHPRHHGQLLIAIFVSVLFALFLALWGFLLIHGPYVHFNKLIYHLFRGIRTPTLDKVAIVFAILGYKYVLLPLLGTLFIWLLICRRFWAAIHWGTVGFIAAGIAFTVKHIHHLSRPPGIVIQLFSSSFPSGHATLSIAFYGFIAFLIAYKKPKPFRKFVYWSAFSLCTAILLSRLYLGAHWLSDVTGAVLLGLSCVYAGVISYRRIKTPRLPIIGILVITLLTVGVGTGIVFHLNSDKILKNSQPYWKTRYISEQQWWNQHSPIIPYYRQDRFGNPTESLNIQWAGSLNDINKTLIHTGWKNILTRNFSTTLKKLLQEKKQGHQNILAKLYKDQPPVIKVLRYYNRRSPPLILRLWPANIHLMPEDFQLWVGTIYYDASQKHYLFFFKNKHNALSIAKTTHLLLPNLTELHWDTKTITPKKLPKNLIKKHKKVEVILIRPHRE